MSIILQKFLKLPDVTNVTGLSRSSLLSLVKSGKFPAPFKINARSVAWNSADVAKWQASILSAH